MNKINLKINSELLSWVLISIFVIIGVYVRFKGLASWPLALDEYYLIKSSGNILKYGLPQFPNGGYYERGLLLQYLIAPLIAMGVKAEFAGRIFPLLSNLLAIPAIYLIAKRAGNQLIALLSVVIFSLSIWEIEFARFARMYAPFQTIFLWYVYFALRDFENKNLTNYKWLVVLSIVSIFLYEGSIFLALLNFAPFFILKSSNIKHLIISVCVFIFSIFFNLYSFKTINTTPIFPSEYLDQIGKGATSLPIKIPKVLFIFSFQADYFSILSPIIIIITILLIVLLIRNLSSKNLFTIFSLIILGICALLNQFGLFLLLFFMFYFWNFLDGQFVTRRNLFLLIVVFSLNLVYWYIYGILSKEWYVLFDDFSSYALWGVSKRLFIGFFDFPENYTSILNYLRTLPLLTIFSGISLLIFFILVLFNKAQNEKIKYLLGIIIFMSLAATIPNVLYDETRYTFFIVPLVTIVVFYSIYYFINNLVTHQLFSSLSFIFIICIVFTFSNDFNFYHLSQIDSENVNFRIIYNDNNYKKHLYRRIDYKTPADYISKNLEENDLIMINENCSEFYLPRVDFFNFDYRHRAFVALTIEEGRKERWSNAKLIYKNNDLLNFIENRQTTIWFLVNPEFWLREIHFYERYKEFLVVQGVDDVIKVFRFPAKK